VTAARHQRNHLRQKQPAKHKSSRKEHKRWSAVIACATIVASPGRINGHLGAALAAGSVGVALTKPKSKRSWARLEVNCTFWATSLLATTRRSRLMHALLTSTAADHIVRQIEAVEADCMVQWLEWT